MERVQVHRCYPAIDIVYWVLRIAEYVYLFSCGKHGFSSNVRFVL